MTRLRGIDLHGKTIKATVLSARPDLWGVTVHVMTDDLGPLVSNMRRSDAVGQLKAGDEVDVVVYCSNLMMAPLFSIKGDTP